MPKYKLATTSTFKRNYKRIKKRVYDLRLLDEIVQKLLNGEQLPANNKDHALSGSWVGYRECHIQSDWLLVYKILEDRLILTLTRTGTHSDIFNE